MHLVIDAVAVRPGSAAIVVGHLMGAWHRTWPADRITVLTDARAGDPGFDVPPGVAVEALTTPVPGPAGGLALRTTGVRRAARRLRPDALLSGVPASGLLGAGCARGVLLYDLRHELRPHQFSRAKRIARRVSWGRSLAGADRVFTISRRTLDDLRARHPRQARRALATPLGSDHVTTWAAPAGGPSYALAFGHFANKNVDAVLAGWAQFCRTDTAHNSWTLRLVGMGSADRAAAADLVRRLGIEDRVELMPWLDDDAFAACFAGAGLVLFPSDFEGFGLPAVEAMRLDIPVVVSSDPALLEVTAGHATVAASASPSDLAVAVGEALALSATDLDRARTHAEGFTWASMAATIRASLLEVAQGVR